LSSEWGVGRGGRGAEAGGGEWGARCVLEWGGGEVTLWGGGARGALLAVGVLELRALPPSVCDW
jgi:hypothetical protein